MNHLLRTLTESQVKPATDLKLLLTAVKDGRKQFPETKLTDPFYDALEGLLLDLKTVTMDNRDAEAFLKPVSRAEVPDYYDVITNAMDFQTMLKKVKQKSYRSKREFQDDLDLIWSNCYTYNASENHPLRKCVSRLKVKAERLLKHITDRKDRYDPAIPSHLPSAIPSRSNGYLNGRSSDTRSPSFTPSPVPVSRASLRQRLNTTFPDSPAIVRTPEGMAMFINMDNEVTSPQPKGTLVHKLRGMAPTFECDEESDDNMATHMEPGPSTGEKRKMNNALDHRPAKRARFMTQYPTPLLEEKDDLSQLWWGAVQSDELLANGLPGNPFGPSSSVSHRKKVKRKRPKRPGPLLLQPQNPKSLVVMMNNNIKTMRRLRHTHAKFVALNASTGALDDEDGGEGVSYSGLASAAPGNRPVLASMPGVVHIGSGVGEDDVVDDKIDERPWIVTSRMSKGGIEIGEANAANCLHWTTDKILEHMGFQGTSRLARDVLADVLKEYLSNVGRTIRFLIDTYGKTMTAEEIILHALFESGTSKIQELERHISDDIERYGGRLGDLEKKLVSAYRETAAGEVLEDEGLFEEESDGETGALAIGEFADVLGEDYLGLRALGIADEFGLSGLSIPKKLLKGKKGQNKPTATKPTEPPPPYPPPPPFLPLSFASVDDQIGLLKPYYQNRFATLAPPTQPVIAPPPPGPSLPSLPAPYSSLLPSHPVSTAPPSNSSAPISPTIRPDLILPDDSPSPFQLKISPIGQIVKSNATAAASKKKAAATKATAAGDGGTVGTPGPSGPTATGSDSGGAKKKKGTTGSGNGRKKKPDGGPGSQPPSVFAGQGGPTLPAVVTASA